ncbi:MAG TPA: hypothetical protein VGW80_08420 [Solirubrobacterales bacterium]|nr:hypothetical protein [Solirubrobacterales bacterium]
MTKPLAGLLAAVVAIAMIAAGCGSSDDSTDSTGSLTKAEFVKQGNAICAKGEKEIGEGFEEFAKENNLPKNKQPSQAQLTEAVEEVVLPTVSDEVESIRDLGLPKEGGKEADEVLKAAEEAIEKGEEDPAALASEKNDPFADANKKARDFGLTKCGEE